MGFSWISRDGQAPNYRLIITPNLTTFIQIPHNWDFKGDPTSNKPLSIHFRYI